MKKKNSLNLGLGESRSTFDMVNKPILKSIFNYFLSPIMQWFCHMRKPTLVPSPPWLPPHNPGAAGQVAVVAVGALWCPPGCKAGTNRKPFRKSKKLLL